MIFHASLMVNSPVCSSSLIKEIFLMWKYNYDCIIVNIKLEFWLLRGVHWVIFSFEQVFDRFLKCLCFLVFLASNACFLFMTCWNEGVFSFKQFVILTGEYHCYPWANGDQLHPKNPPLVAFQSSAAVTRSNWGRQSFMAENPLVSLLLDSKETQRNGGFWYCKRSYLVFLCKCLKKSGSQPAFQSPGGWLIWPGRAGGRRMRGRRQKGKELGGIAAAL